MIEDVVELIKEGNVAVLTGAGISTRSGIPDFRGENGLYKRYSMEIFDYDFFVNNPEKFYDFMTREFSKIYDAEPNFAHKFLAKLEDEGIVNGIITQNIDNLHLKAGSKNVIELHGNATRFYCMNCGRKKNDISNGYICECGGLIRPDIVFFKESVKDLEKAYELIEFSDTLMVIGSSLEVYPAAYFPLFAKELGKDVVIINKDPTSADSYADIVINDDIVDFFKELSKNF